LVKFTTLQFYNLNYQLDTFFIAIGGFSEIGVGEIFNFHFKI